jgi:glycogen operon protein
MSWTDWNLDDRKRSLLEFTSRLMEIRHDHPNLHRRKFFQDRTIHPGKAQRKVDGKKEKDIEWLRPDGCVMTAEEWSAGWIRCIGLMLNGRTLDDVNGVGEPIVDDTFLLLLNPHHESIQFYMPRRPGKEWEVLISSAAPEATEREAVRAGKPYELIPRSTALLRERKD